MKCVSMWVCVSNQKAADWRPAAGNGTILGMTRAEIKRKFDEIVDFSGVEKFLDTPVKFYSSG